MPLRDQDRAVWIGDESERAVGSSGKVRFGVERNHRMIYVDWGDGEGNWYEPDRQVVTCRQAANKGIEPWAKAFAPRASRGARKPYSPPRIV